MAKLNAPLLSFAASGQIAKAIVYFPWKGINAARQYVVPANPRSDDQIAQRALMTAAVLEWHDAEYSADDVTAWNRFAGTLAKIMSGFNAMIRTHIDEGILTNVWTRLHDGGAKSVLATSFVATVYAPTGGLAPTIHWGTRKTHFPNSLALTEEAASGEWTNLVTPLIASTLYYFYYDVGTSGATYARTGIYQQRTAA